MSFIWNNKKRGVCGDLRKPLVPLFKVYDLRRNLSDYIEKFFTQSALCFARISVNRQSGHPVKFNGMFPYSLNLIVFACALSFPFFKLSHTFFAVEKVHDRRDKRASQRIDLVLRYSRVVFPSRHSPLLCNLLDTVLLVFGYSVLLSAAGVAV